MWGLHNGSLRGAANPNCERKNFKYSARQLFYLTHRNSEFKVKRVILRHVIIYALQ